MLIDWNQCFQWFDLIVFFFMIKPSWTNTCINLCRIPDKLLLILYQLIASQILIWRTDNALSKLRIILLLAVFLNLFRISCAKRYNTPLRFSRTSSLISAPAHIWSAHMNTGIWLQSSYHFIISLPIIVLLFPIWSFPTCTVKPYSKDRSILCQKFR